MGIIVNECRAHGLLTAHNEKNLSTLKSLHILLTGDSLSFIPVTMPMKHSELKQLALDLSEGILSSIADLTLFTFFLTFTSFGKAPTYPGYDRAFAEAHELLRDVNYKIIKQAIIHMKKRGLVTYKKRHLEKTLTVTAKGEQFVKRQLPTYQIKRPWSGRIYLIIYDIPETRKRMRERLRKFIKLLGGAMLQESVWLMFNDPTTKLKTIIDEHQLQGVVIVANTGKDGSVGAESVDKLVQRLYHLERINREYEKFIAWTKVTPPTLFHLTTKYFSILKNDPQLPFELLPKKWLGEAAYKLFIKHGGKLLV